MYALQFPHVYMEIKLGLKRTKILIILRHQEIKLKKRQGISLD
jgi:hypothetical protein